MGQSLVYPGSGSVCGQSRSLSKFHRLMGQYVVTGHPGSGSMCDYPRSVPTFHKLMGQCVVTLDQGQCVVSLGLFPHFRDLWVQCVVTLGQCTHFKDFCN